MPTKEQIANLTIHLWKKNGIGTIKDCVRTTSIIMGISSESVYAATDYVIKNQRGIAFRCVASN